MTRQKSVMPLLLSFCSLNCSSVPSQPLSRIDRKISTHLLASDVITEWWSNDHNAIHQWIWTNYTGIRQGKKKAKNSWALNLFSPVVLGQCAYTAIYDALVLIIYQSWMYKSKLLCIFRIVKLSQGLKLRIRLPFVCMTTLPGWDFLWVQNYAGSPHNPHVRAFYFDHELQGKNNPCGENSITRSHVKCFWQEVWLINCLTNYREFFQEEITYKLWPLVN